MQEFRTKIAEAWKALKLPERFIDRVISASTPEEIRSMWVSNHFPPMLVNGLIDEVQYSDRRQVYG